MVLLEAEWGTRLANKVVSPSVRLFEGWKCDVKFDALSKVKWKRRDFKNGFYVDWLF